MDATVFESPQLQGARAGDANISDERQDNHCREMELKRKSAGGSVM